MPIGSLKKKIAANTSGVVQNPVPIQWSYHLFLVKQKSFPQPVSIILICYLANWKHKGKLLTYHILHH